MAELEVALPDKATLVSRAADLGKLCACNVYGFIFSSCQLVLFFGNLFLCLFLLTNLMHLSLLFQTDFLADIGGLSLQNTVSNVMSKIMTADLSRRYNWKEDCGWKSAAPEDKKLPLVT